MKTLDQHNAERREFLAKVRDASQSTGIACPECGKELIRTNPNTLCLSIPPQINVHCECGYRGYAVA